MKMKTINLSEVIKDLEGNPMHGENTTIGNVLAQYLMSISTKNSLALYHIAKKLVENKKVTLTEEEYDSIIQLVTSSNMDNLTKSLVLIAMNGD